MAQTTASFYENRTVLDRDNHKIGKVDSLYLDEDTGQLEWALVNSGMFGTKNNFVLLRGATMQQEDIQVAFDKDTVHNAPRVDAGGELSSDEERQLFDHYGMAYGEKGNRGASAGATQSSGADHRSTTSGNEAMTRSEEEMHVGTESRERGRARLHKYVVTEHEQVTVPVRHEEVWVEREQIDGTNRDEALSGAAISEDEQEMTLHEERVVADTETVPKERVRMSKHTETDEETVSADLRKERIDADDDTNDPNQR